jgi:hypothetical protein
MSMMTALDRVRLADQQWFVDHPGICEHCRPMAAAEYRALSLIGDVPRNCSVHDGLVRVNAIGRHFSWRHHPATKTQ